MSEQKILKKRIGEKVPDSPQVSVVIPAYNVADFIAETLDSVLSQTFKDYEIILVNDGSPDTEKLEKTLAPYLPHLVYIKQENSGTAAARNAAINSARGEWLAFLDGDDVWFPEYLTAQMEALSAKNCDLIYCDALLFGEVRDKSERYTKRSPSHGAVKTESLISGECNVITSGTIAKRLKVLECGMFDEDLPRIGMEDFDLWFRLAKNGVRLDYQKRILLKYRVRVNSLSGSNVQRAERSLIAFDTLEQKYELTDAEKRILKIRKEKMNAQLEVEKGKLNLSQENFTEALDHFRMANKHHRKQKLSVLILLLKIYPQLILKIFKKFRPEEYSFIEPKKL
jgi:glycosyltransferase involved in cell wall biosynthesis